MRLALLLLLSVSLLPADVVYTLDVTVSQSTPNGIYTAAPSQVFSLDLPGYMTLQPWGTWFDPLPGCSLLGDACGNVLFQEETGPYNGQSNALLIQFPSAEEPNDGGPVSEYFQFNGASVDQLGTFSGLANGEWTYPTTATLTIVDPPAPGSSVPEPASWMLLVLATAVFGVSRLTRLLRLRFRPTGV